MVYLVWRNQGKLNKSPYKRKKCTQTLQRVRFFTNLEELKDITMKRLIIILSMALCFSIGFIVEAKSTMELLINKDWHEFYVSTMKLEKAYTRFTGTQRMIIDVDSVGNTTAKVQPYYLSNRYETKFDSTKIGRAKSGKYIILKSNSSTNDCVCLKIKLIDKFNLKLKDESSIKLLEQSYLSMEENDIKGDVISTRDLLIDKFWFEIDEKTGKRTQLDFLFNTWSLMTCKRPEEGNYTDIPTWNLYEYYLSDEIEIKFNPKKIEKRVNGLYLVTNERTSEGKWQVVNYDITTLSANRLVLDCVYPKDYIKRRVFEHKNSHTIDSITEEHKTIRKKLMGKQWRIVKWEGPVTTKIGKGYYTRIHYFTETRNVVPHFKKIKGGYEFYLKSPSYYYLTDIKDDYFKDDEFKKDREMGKYMVLASDKSQNVWAIQALTKSLFVTSNAEKNLISDFRVFCLSE